MDLDPFKSSSSTTQIICLGGLGVPGIILLPSDSNLAQDQCVRVPDGQSQLTGLTLSLESLNGFLLL